MRSQTDAHGFGLDGHIPTRATDATANRTKEGKESTICMRFISISIREKEKGRDATGAFHSRRQNPHAAGAFRSRRQNLNQTHTNTHMHA